MAFKEMDLSDVDKGWEEIANPNPEKPDRPAYHKVDATTERPSSAIEQAYWIQYEGRVPIIGYGELPDGSPYSVFPKDLLPKKNVKAA